MASHQTITIKKALENIQGKNYAMPAIQREFVWSPGQIEKLFDSLLQGYPIGSFLFWNVDRSTFDKYTWYDFITHYHQRDHVHNQIYEPLDNVSGLTAILDGQQRLTALNIGLRGTYAHKLPWHRWDSNNAFPQRNLYLNIDKDSEDNEFGMKYDFKFLTLSEFEKDGQNQKWFKVADIIDRKYKEEAEVMYYLIRNRLMTGTHDGTDTAIDEAKLGRLRRLHKSIWEDERISYFFEEEQDLNRVLHIFVRTNSGGTVLSHSDILLAIATAQFTKLDARQEVNDRTAEFNAIGDGFEFPKDFVLKAALVLSDCPVRFDIENFTAENLQVIEGSWEEVMAALRLAVMLADQFGLSGGRLASQNALLPIAYHFRKIGANEDSLTRSAFGEERERMKKWLLRTLIKRVWGGSSDTLLAGLRRVIRSFHGSEFPVNELSVELGNRGRGLSFSDVELQDVVDTEYGARAFALMTVLYPFVDVAAYKFHMDHVFPKARLSGRALDQAGLSDEEKSEVRRKVNRLPNLQLLTGTRNSSKNTTLPRQWLDENFDSNRSRLDYAMNHDLGDLAAFPNDVRGFVAWYDGRRDLMLQRLRRVLGPEEWLQ